MHLASTEAYVVIGGRGALQTLDLSGFRETELSAGSTVWFTPGTIHRAINTSDLQVVVVMANAGLPEAGDAVMTFPPGIVGDAAQYRAAATLPSGVTDAHLDAAAQHRRQLAVEEFLRLAHSIENGDPGPLEEFYASAVALVRPAIAGWRQTWERTVGVETQRTAEVLDALERGDGRHLRDAALRESPPSPRVRWGMCGYLTTHDVADPVVRPAIPPPARPPATPSGRAE